MAEAIRFTHARFWRTLSTGPWLLAALLFFLPWVSVSCDAPNVGHKVFATQSGFQAIYGGHMLSAFARAEIERGQVNRDPDEPSFFARCSPMMLIYLWGLIVAVIVSLAFRSSRIKTIIICCLSAGLLFLTAIQGAIGFPIERRVNEPANQAHKEPGAFLADPQEQLRQEIERLKRNIEARNRGLGTMLVDVNYTTWFWLEILVVCMAGSSEFLLWRITKVTGESRALRVSLFPERGQAMG